MLDSFLLFITAAFLRFSEIGILPVGQHNSYLLRLISAFLGTLSVVIFFNLIKKYTHNRVLALISGFIYCFMPWHIEQSRVISQPIFGLTLILFSIWIFRFLPCKYCKILIFITGGIIFYRLYPDFWIFQGNFRFIGISNYLHNLFKLISVKFLFFENDSFWWGGLRTYGVMLPGFIPVFLIGLFIILKNFSKKFWKWYLLFIGIWLMSALSPNLPESREYFLISPFLAFVGALGFYKMMQIVNKKILLRTIFFIYLMFIIYEYILLTHYYAIHYPQRIRSEVPYEKINF